ncbi:hypothetical protein [Pseudothauera lacus]|uniref:Uncharacterized protein n=1 Tax=Pseudothauera lacus TaxID=2136175 RepID=A0A2T4IEQ3_9RHOO|nr:hypothetical protein [Pseudothauera lacus]PTD96260.1 hypothetical protein C8261_10090 [Pseudothauera lacus]
MKIDHLPLGARFQWKGQTYTKVGPMTASADAGGTAFIPKHAVLQPMSGEAPPQPEGPPAAAQVDTAVLQAAFEDYHRCALALAGAAAQGELERARQRFWSALG